MDKEPRKATDVLLDMESKLNTLVSIVKALDLNIKIISNKLNNLDGVVKQISTAPPAPKFSMEAVNVAPTKIVHSMPPDPDRDYVFTVDGNAQIDKTPNGFRRTSRPETYSGDNMFLPAKDKKNNPPAGREEAQIIIPEQAKASPKQAVQQKQQISPPQNVVQNAIPVMQRIVDKNGKSIFLADVEILDANKQPIFKTRTNGTGKWMASLSVGTYTTMIRKGASSNKEKIEVGQVITIDGTSSPCELNTMIIR